MINQDDIDAIKHGVELVSFMKARGIELHQVGGNYRGLCPFHEDTTPSLTVNPKENLWNCFGCGAGGDVIRFVELIDQVDFTQAVKRLSANHPKPGKPKTAVKEKKKEISVADKKLLARGNRIQKTEDRSQKRPGKKVLSVADKKLLARVVGYYQHSFTEDSRGVDYLRNRGITTNQTLTDFGAGFVNGSLKKILPEDPAVIKTLKNLGILNAKGNEIFYNCVVFPIYDTDGAIVNLYGRNIDPAHGVSHLYLAGSRVRARQPPGGTTKRFHYPYRIDYRCGNPVRPGFYQCHSRLWG
jgi:DNA primase